MCTNLGYAMSGGAGISAPYSANDGDEADAFFGKGDPGGMYPQWDAATSQDEKDAVKWYTGSSYYNLNSKLRSGTALSPSQKEKQEKMDSAISKFELRRDIQVYRGSSNALLGGLSDPDQINAQLKGKIVRDKGYVSTAAVKDNALFFGEIEYRITVKAGKGKGVWAKPVSNVKGENEFLLARGTEFKVLRAKKHPTSPDKTIVYLEC